MNKERQQEINKSPYQYKAFQLRKKNIILHIKNHEET